MTTMMFAPSGRTGTVMASGSQTNYTIGSDGAIQAIADDVVSLLRAGFTIANRTSNSANGLAVTRLNLLDFKNADGTTLAASPAAGKFGLTETPGTVEALVGETATSNTKTDTAIAEFRLPANYVAASDITVNVNCKLASTGTAGTKTLAVAAYKSAAAGTEGTTLIATAAQNLPASSGDLAYVITGASLVPGDELVLTLVAVVQETAAGTLNAQINSVRYG